MPTVQEHRLQAERNEELVAAITTLPERFPEWEVTALFYSALHYVDAFLVAQGLNPGNHHRRSTLAGELTNIGTEYQDLFELSMDARYRLVEFSTNDADEVKDGIFRRVKEEMLRLLGTGEP